MNSFAEIKSLVEDLLADLGYNGHVEVSLPLTDATDETPRYLTDADMVVITINGRKPLELGWYSLKTDAIQNVKRALVSKLKVLLAADLN